MHRICRQILILLLVLPGCQAAYSQADKAVRGSLVVNGKISAPTPQKPKNTESLRRVRFYLFRDGKVANKQLIDKLNELNLPSRDCFYASEVHVCAEFIDWLKSEKCESVHCREITAEDNAKVQEFQTAFERGKESATLKKQPELAQKWIVTNLEPVLSSEFYKKRHAEVTSLLEKNKEKYIGSSMTGNTGTSAYFLNIPLTKSKPDESEPLFLYTNLIPLEIGKKSYVWACEISIADAERKTTPLFEKPAASKFGEGKCDIIVRDLPVCDAKVCKQQ